MQITRYHSPYHHPAKKPRRRLPYVIVLGVCVVLFAGGWYIATSSHKTSPTKAVVQSQRMTLLKNIKLAWPVTGQAAIANVEDKLLARSSADETTRPTASMAKIITALAIMEKQSFNPGETGQSYTITAEDIADYQKHAANGGSVVPVYVGMKLTQYQAMQAMLIASGNNMADMLTERVFGSTEDYVLYAQGMLKRMGLSHTTVFDASGFSPNTTSTPLDLITLGIAALKNPVIAEIVAQPQAWIPGVGTIKNTNELLEDEGVVGIKTGTTDEAGSCLLFGARYTKGDGRSVTIVGVVMGDIDTTTLFNDSRQLLVSARQVFNANNTR